MSLFASGLEGPGFFVGAVVVFRIPYYDSKEYREILMSKRLMVIAVEDTGFERQRTREILIERSEREREKEKRKETMSRIT